MLLSLLLEKKKKQQEHGCALTSNAKLNWETEHEKKDAGPVRDITLKANLCLDGDILTTIEQS